MAAVILAWGKPLGVCCISNSRLKTEPNEIRYRASCMKATKIIYCDEKVALVKLDKIK
jgi:hypothetical protein